MSLCASQAFTSVVAKSSAGYASNLSGKPQSRLPPSLYCHPFSPPVKLHRCLSPLIPSISKHRRWNQGSLCGGGIQCSAQEEGGDFGGEAAPQEGWERDAAAARVAELAQKAGAAGAGRRKLSFKAVTAAAEGSKKGEDGGSEVAPEARDVGVRKRPVIREVPFAGGRSEVADGGFDEEPPRRDDELSKRLVPRPRMEDGARFGGGLQRRQEQAPNGGTGLGDQKGPWVRKGASKGESVRSGDDDFFRGEDNVTEARSREGYRDRQTDEFAEEGSYRGGFEESGDRSNRNFNRERNVGRYEDQDSFEGGRESRRSFQGGAKGARNRGWEEGTNDFYRGENDYGPESGRNVWRRETGVVENGGEFRPPAPKPVWRNREGGEEVLGTKAWVARQRAEAEGGIGGRGAPDDWTERPPRNGRGRGGDPRGASYRRERMGVRAWNEQDDAFESERGDAPSKGQRRRGGDFSDGLESESWGGESKNDEEGAGEISSWGPRGNTKKVGVRGSGSVGGRGSFSRGGRRSEETGAGFSRTFNAPGGPRSGERFRRSEREDQFSARDEWSPRESAQKRSDTQRGSRSPSEPSQSPSELSRGPSESDRDFARGPFDSARRSASANNGADSTFVRARSNGARGFGYEDFSAPDDVGKTSLSAEEKKERQRMKRVKLEGPGCYGCGARLQVSHPGGPGYLRPDVYELKRTHRQLGETLCGRCTELAHGKMVPAVGGNGGHGSGGQQEGYVMAEELREQLKPLKLNKVLVVKLVDIADFNGSFLSKVRDLVGSNPIILVGTKVDLLPADTDLEAVADWVWEATVRKKLKPISVHLISSLTGAGLPSLAANIQRERQGRDVYVLGAANVGKSAFINALLAELATRDPAAAAARRRRPTESAMPGTTLGPIPINAFSGGGELFDTPGIHLHHRLASLLTPEELGVLAPKRRLRPVAPTIATGDQATAQEDGSAPHNESPASDSNNGASHLNGSGLTPGDFVVLRPHPSCPPQAVFVAQIFSSGGSETVGSERGGTFLARPWMPKPVRRGPKMDLWNDPWGRKWVPYEGGVFELAPDDGIASWQSRAKAPEEGIPIPPLVAARVEEVVRGGNLPAPAYPPWIDGSGEIVDPKEWGGKMGVVAGEGSGNVGEIEHSGGALLRAGRGGETPSDGIEGTTFFWGGVARIDVLQAPPGLRLFFYGPHTVAVHAVDSNEADPFYKANLFEKLTPPFKDRGADWNGLPYKKECNLYSEDDVRPAGDVVVSGLGWFAVGGAPGKRGRRGGSQSSSRGEVRLLVHTPRGVEVYLRPSMPVTETGTDWFDRPDLDVELERPPIYYPRQEQVSRPQGLPSKAGVW